MVTINKRGRFQTLWLTLLCQTTQALPLAGLPLLLPLIRQDLGLSFAQAGGLASANLLVYALMQIPAGYLSDHYSPRKMVVIGTLGLMGFSILLALARQYWQILGIQFFWGFFSALMFTPAMSVFIRWVSPQNRTTAATLPSVGPGVGIFAVNLLFPVIVNRCDTWRLPFIIVGVAGIVFALALLIFGKDTPLRDTPVKLRPEIIREVFRYKQVWICYGLQFIRFGIVQGLGFWLPTLLISEKGFPLQLAGIVIALQPIIRSPTSLLGAYFSDRFNKPTFIVGVSMVMLGITTGLLVNLNAIWSIIAVIIVNAIFIQMYFGPLFTMAIEKLGAEKTGISNGVSNMFAIFGGLISAYLMGVLRDATGSFEWGFYSISIMCAAGLILTIILQGVRRAKTITGSKPE